MQASLDCCYCLRYEDSGCLLCLLYSKLHCMLKCNLYKSFMEMYSYKNYSCTLCMLDQSTSLDLETSSVNMYFTDNRQFTFFSYTGTLVHAPTTCAHNWVDLRNFFVVIDCLGSTSTFIRNKLIVAVSFVSCFINPRLRYHRPSTRQNSSEFFKV